jgi:phospho-N-acetylmuramoyl-pentapeptide-transferase
MVAIIIALTISLFVSLLGTPFFIRFLTKKKLGQFIRQDGPQHHMVKRGTPTMGGIMIIVATIIGWLVASCEVLFSQHRYPGASAILLMFLMVGMGFLGFLDDFTKIRKKQNLGLSPIAKIIGQTIIGVIFAVLSLNFPNEQGWTPGSTTIMVSSNFSINLAFAGKALGVILFIVWVQFIITAWSNAVNLTDGLDGLASGISIIVFSAYAILCLWMTSQSCLIKTLPAICYTVRDPWDLAIVAAAIAGACFGFLWWNTSPAQIFMGDTGSLALGGAFAGLSIITNTEVLSILLGGVFVFEVISDVIQISCFKLTRKRVFKMAPIHHHFELSGWGEVTIVTRFWLLSAICAASALAIFYADWLTLL